MCAIQTIDDIHNSYHCIVPILLKRKQLATILINWHTLYKLHFNTSAASASYMTFNLVFWTLLKSFWVLFLVVIYRRPLAWSLSLSLSLSLNYWYCMSFQIKELWYLSSFSAYFPRIKVLSQMLPYTQLENVLGI